MKRAAKWIVLVCLVAVVLAVVAVELIDWNFLKPRIAAQVKQATGRELSIGGDVEIDLLPRPRIVLHDVALANPDWTTPEHFVELERLRVAPDLLAAAVGRVALARIDIDAPKLRLVDRSNAPPNWAFAGNGDSGATDPVPVHRLDVTNAEILYRAPGAERTLDFRVPSIRVRDDGESASASAKLVIRDREVEFDAETDSLFSGLGLDESFEGELRVATEESRIDSEFALSRPSFPAEWKMRVDADIEDVDRWTALIPGADSTGIGSLALEVSLARSGSTWKAEEVDVTALEGSLKADLEVDTGGEVPVLNGSIRSNSINVAALREALPGSDSSAAASESLPRVPVLPRWNGSIAFDIEQIAGLAVPITDATAVLRFEGHRMSLENVEVVALGSTVRGSAHVSSAPDAVSAGLSLSAEDVELEEESERGPALDGDAQLRLEPVARDRWERAAIVRSLHVETATLEYTNPESNTRLTTTVLLAGKGARPEIELSGTLAGRPLDARIEGEALASAFPGPKYALRGQATSADLALSVETTLDSVMNLHRFDGHITLAGNGADDLEPWLGPGMMQTPPFEVAGRLDRDDGQWVAEEVRVEVGQSRLRGSVQVDVDGRPHVAVALQADPLDLGWLQDDSEDGGTDRSSGDGSSGLAWLRGFDADFEFDATEVRLAGGPMLVGLDMKAVLEQGVVEVRRFGTNLAGGTFSVEGRIDAAETPASATIDADFEDIALGRLAETFSPLEERLGLLSGNARIVVTGTLDKAYRDDVLAPMIGRLKIEPSELRFTDAEAGTDLLLKLRTEGLASDGQRFRIDGSGRYDGDRVALEYRSDPLLDIRLPDRPYAVGLDATIVETRIELDGTLLRPLALEGLDLQLALAGPNPQRLSRLLGVPLPELPPYDVSGQLGMETNRWSLSDLDGTVGDSDLRGNIAFDADASPPALTGELRSDSLDIDDLAGIAGAEPAAGEGETASERQRRQARAERSDRFVLPDDPIIGDAWREVTADVRYRGNSVRAGDVPLTDLVIDFSLKDGVARFEPVGFGVGDGSVDFTLDLDANHETPEGTLSVEMRAVDLRKAVADWDLADDSVGIVAAQGQFWVSGDSIADLLGSADGGLVMLMTEGRLEALLVELAGLDASQAFLSWIGGRAGIPINCAYVDLKSRDGTVDVDTFVIDTDDTIFTVGGRVNLDDERLDLSVVAHPQDASALVGRTPFHLGGTFDDIDAGIHGGELGLRVGASAGLAALAGPLAAVVPLLEVGVDDRTGYCQGLVERTRGAIETGKDGR
ncbi:MAG: AsmA family protein [Candidatus Wenzhouxiangella sp. M2_3B_020]